MWVSWVLGASFTILVLAGLEIVPQWSKPCPESAMFQALLVLLLLAGLGIGVIPVAVAVHRGGMDWIPFSRAVRWCVAVGGYVLVACGAAYAIVMGTGRNSPVLWKSAALEAGLVLHAAYGF
ncbi:MAG: hypothetical protein JNL62_23110, partial [Bryobacterales bacterium]|nr:hypothetical protein [Bryobacterales bacterium]